jgi:hypothetical protein
MPGSCISTIKQAALSVESEAKKSSAEPNLSTGYPADSMQSPSASCTKASSSTIAMWRFVPLLI